MKSLMSLWSSVAIEMAARCCTSTTRDQTTVARRFEHEGLSFLAITLADYGKAIQKWLDHGQVVPSDCPAFKKTPGGRIGIPAFLGGFLGLVFDPFSGTILDEPDIEAIIALRELTLMFSKIALPEGPQKGTLVKRVTTRQRESKAMLNYVQCEQDVKESDARMSAIDLADFSRVSDLLYASVFSRVDSDIYYSNLMPKHGPGATADRLSSNGKYDMRTWTARLERSLPCGELTLPSWSYYDQLEKTDILEPGAEMPVRVITVPKTLKTPRIIAMEPAAMMYCQQALYRSLLDSLQKDSLLSRIIGFDDQEPNRLMAQQGSLCGDLATLDLSDASDRVSNQLVRAMLRNHPHLLAAVDAARSRKADVPGQGVIRLAKFASMGSALCFPFEAMAFMAMIYLGIERGSSVSLNRRALYKQVGKVRVFGDDLIVPVRHVHSVIRTLEAFGSRVNTDKSYWTGRFRESCGREYYAGQDVSIVKVRRTFPSGRQDANGVISIVALRNQLYLAGFWQSSRWLDEYIGKVLSHFPTVLPTSPLLGRISSLGYVFQRLDPNTHGPLTKGFSVRAESPSDPLEGSGALLKCFLKLESRNPGVAPLVDRDAGPVGFIPDGSWLLTGLPPGDEKHLERSGRPKHVSIKLGWRSPV